MPVDHSAFLRTHRVRSSAPCRVDLGGTLDIRTFFNFLQPWKPATVNLALDQRTTITLAPGRPGWVEVTSTGFQPAEYPLGRAPFDHPLGLIFAVASHFEAEGVRIAVDSASPPRSALGGSSVAAVALIGALDAIRCRAAGSAPLSPRQTALLAHSLEESVARVPCGVQDQLAAAYGGANCWHWRVTADGPDFAREALDTGFAPGELEPHLLVAYAGVPHDSGDINGLWVAQFLAAEHREEWQAIAACVHDFAAAFASRNWTQAAAAMNRETALRRRLTPAVLDDLGVALVEAAAERGCGARFTGAGGGGCLWAIGAAGPVAELRGRWQALLDRRPGARLLPHQLDRDGVRITLEAAG
jgi:D-glycero-alpha-D-manno-heptose-7-phosphate kinase